jgi:hypothetical protein
MVPSLSFLVPKVAVWGMEMQTCSLNLLALTVGVLVETPIYFLSFLVPKVAVEVQVEVPVEAFLLSFLPMLAIMLDLLVTVRRRWRCTPQLVLRLSTRTGLDCAILLLLESFAPICHLLRIMLRLLRNRCMRIFYTTTLANPFVG